MIEVPVANGHRGSILFLIHGWEGPGLEIKSVHLEISENYLFLSFTLSNAFI